MLAWRVVRSLPRRGPSLYRVLSLFARHWHPVLMLPVAVADSEASSDPLAYDDYQTPNTHRLLQQLTMLPGIPSEMMLGKADRTFLPLPVIGRVVIGSTYRLPCIDMPRIDNTRFGYTFRFHTFHGHVT
jgi:hypothetical protein